LKVSTNVKIAMQCFENFGEANAPNAPPLVARLPPIAIFPFTLLWRYGRYDDNNHSTRSVQF